MKPVSDIIGIVENKKTVPDPNSSTSIYALSLYCCKTNQVNQKGVTDGQQKTVRRPLVTWANSELLTALIVTRYSIFS